jgi:ribosome-binding factor A
MAGERKARVAEAIRDTLAQMISREVKDPRVQAAGLVSITHVELNADMSVATVYVSVFGDDRTASRAVEGLRAATGFLRGPVARRLQMARPPELRFQRDTGLAFGMELQQIVRDDERRAREAGRGEAPAAPPEPASPEREGGPADDDDDGGGA